MVDPGLFKKKVKGYDFLVVNFEFLVLNLKVSINNYFFWGHGFKKIGTAKSWGLDYGCGHYPSPWQSFPGPRPLDNESRVRNQRSEIKSSIRVSK
jgi:hypothetical protein